MDFWNGRKKGTVEQVSGKKLTLGQQGYCFYNLTFVSPFQARNIAVFIEFKDSDEDEAQPLKVHLHIRKC